MTPGPLPSTLRECAAHPKPYCADVDLSEASPPCASSHALTNLSNRLCACMLACSEADKLEEEQDNSANEALLGGSLGDDNMLAAVDEKNNAVCVINAQGA